MFKTIAVATLLAAGLTAPGHANRAQMNFEDAVDLCTTQAVRFGKTIHGRYADEPPANLVQSKYRACVYAHSQQYPTQEVDYRETLFSLQKVFE